MIGESADFVVPFLQPSTQVGENVDILELSLPKEHRGDGTWALTK